MNDLQLPINSIRFAPTAQSLCIALANGFAIFTLGDLKLRIHRTFDDQSFGNVSCFNDSNLVVCSSTFGSSISQEKMLSIYDNTLGRIVFEVQSPEPIKSIFSLKKFFGFSTKSECRIYTYDPPILYSQFKSPSNDRNTCDLVESGDSFVLAMIGRNPGNARIIRGEKGGKKDISITAHSHPIVILKLSCDGEFLATASSLGTVIKLYSTKTGNLIGQFRRGTLQAEIQSISFSPNSELIAISSSKGTIHVFPIKRLNGSISEIRSEMKTTCSTLISPVLCFASNNILYAASNSGIISTFTINETVKTINITDSESFADCITNH